MMQRVTGQGDDLARLLRRARSLSMPHGVLLAGPPGCGKSTAARQLAAALLCPEPGAEEACGSCGTCTRVASDQHPDLHLLRVPEERRDIPVELVRELQESLLRLPMEGRARVVIVDPADRLNEQGQNALLKTLEEPGAHTFLLLATARPEEMMETVRSRVQTLRLRTLDEDQTRALLQGKNPRAGGELERVLRLAGGAVGRAQRLLEADARQTHDLVVGFLDGTYPSGPVALAREVLEGTEGRREVADRARLCLFLLGAEARARLGALASLDADAYPARPWDAWTASLELLFDAGADLDLQIPPEQALVSLFLAWHRADPR